MSPPGNIAHLLQSAVGVLRGSGIPGPPCIISSGMKLSWGGPRRGQHSRCGHFSHPRDRRWHQPLQRPRRQTIATHYRSVWRRWRSLTFLAHCSATSASCCLGNPHHGQLGPPRSSRRRRATFWTHGPFVVALCGCAWGWLRPWASLHQPWRQTPSGCAGIALSHALELVAAAACRLSASGAPKTPGAT